MRWFRNMNTHSKLLLAFALLTFTTALASGWSILTAIQLRQLVVNVQTQAGYLEGTANAQADFQGLVTMSRNYWLTRSPFYLGQATRYQQQIDDYLRRAMVAAQSADEREDINTLIGLLDEHAANLEQISAQLLEESAGPAEGEPLEESSQDSSPGPQATPEGPPGSEPPQDGQFAPKATPGVRPGATPPGEPPEDRPSEPMAAATPEGPGSAERGCSTQAVAC